MFLRGMDGAIRNALAQDRADAAGRMRRRRVVHSPGHDPLPPRRHLALIRREGAAQAAISGHAPGLGGAPSGARWPPVISAATSRVLDPDRLRALRGRFFRLHFPYLCAFDRPGVSDHFAITAGPKTLAARFALCRLTPGRIGTAPSTHRGPA